MIEIGSNVSEANKNRGRRNRSYVDRGTHSMQPHSTRFRQKVYFVTSLRFGVWYSGSIMHRLLAWFHDQAWLAQFARRWRQIVLVLIALYLVVATIVAHAAYTELTPSARLRSLTVAVPVPVARVDQSFILMSEYLERYTYITSFIQKTDQQNFTPQKARDQVIDYLVETRLITQLASQQHVTVSPKESAAAYDQLAKQPGVGGTQQIEQVLRELYGMTPSAFQRLLAEQLLRERVEQQVFLHVKARHILVSTDADAYRVLDDLKAGTSFDDEAKQFSQDAKTRDQGGDLGFVGRGSGLPKPLEDEIFALAVDAAPVFVKSDLGYHIVDTEERVGVIDTNFADWLTAQKHERSITVYLHTTLDWAQPKKK